MCNIYYQFTDKEKIVYNRYKTNQSLFVYKLNDSLRSNRGIGTFQDDINILDNIIVRFPCENELILHRATNEELILPFIEDNIYRNPDYLSTASDIESIQYHFKNPVNPVYLKLICSNNTYALNMELNEQSSGLEMEILIGRNNRFIVIENRLATQFEMEEIMGRDNAIGVSSLRIITVLS